MQPLDIRRQQNLPRSRRHLVEMLKIRRFINRLNICKPMFHDSESVEATNKAFAVAIVRFARTLPTDPAILVIMRQLVKSGTSVGANYRSSCRAKSRADFVSKMTTAEEEADETLYWLEVLSDAGIVKASTVAALIDEADQLVRIFVASINTARGSRR